MRGLIVLIAMFCLAGCGTIRVTAPATPADASRVYVADFGDTARLVLPDDSDPPAYTEYGFGDWRWYAKNQTNLLYGPVALLVPTRGTLGRRNHDADPAWYLPDLGAEDVLAIDVDRALARALRTRLDEAFDAADERVHNPERGLDFATSDHDYWLFNQSSTSVAGWLDELGCETSGWTLVADFELDR
ncbi:MAG: hypothetical protein RIB60_11025 [Phycisphaerales bacterium]